MANAFADGIIVKVIPSGSQIRIANTRAKLEKGVELGLMRGQSMAARSSLVFGAVAIGKTPLSLMPCAGDRRQGRGQEHRQRAARPGRRAARPHQSPVRGADFAGWPRGTSSAVSAWLSSARRTC